MTDNATPWPKHRRATTINRILDRLAALPQTSRDVVLAEAGWPLFGYDFVHRDYVGRLSGLRDSQLADMDEAVLRLSAGVPPVVSRRSLSEGDRSLYLDQVAGIFNDIDQDADLSDADRVHFLELVRALGSALRETDARGTQPVEDAAKLVFADASLNPDQWKGVKGRGWANRLASLVVGLLYTLEAVGGYPGAKALVEDIWSFASPGIAAVTQAQSRSGPEVIDAEVVPDDEYDSAAPS